MNLNKVFWKRKTTETLGHAYTYTRMCTHAHALHAHASCMRTHTRACVHMHAHARVLETMKGKFLEFKIWFGTNPTLSGSHSKPLFYNYKKPYMVPFQDTEKIRRGNTRFTRNSESKEFFTKYSQVNIFLIKTFSGLDLRVSSFN